MAALRGLAFRSLALTCCCLATVVCGQTLLSQEAWGQADDEEAAPLAKQDLAVKAKPPVRVPPARQPKKPLPPLPLLVQQGAANLPAKPVQRPVGQKAAQPLPANRRPLPTNRRPNPPFWSPRQSQLPSGQLRRGQLSHAAVYHLESLGTHVHLTPAMRWHLNRSGAAVSPSGATSPSSATVPGQGAEKFYPGVSRWPTQKPFADLERPASGLQSYWPFLLEGRQDPNTGLIIWSLP